MKRSSSEVRRGCHDLPTTVRDRREPCADVRTLARADGLAHGPGLAHLRLDLLVVLLACLGYGAVFLAFSLLFKNPVVPAVMLAFWEGVNGALPAWLKHLSVTFYLKPLFPVELPMKGILSLFTVVTEPTPRWLAVTGLFVFCLVVTFAAGG